MIADCRSTAVYGMPAFLGALADRVFTNCAIAGSSVKGGCDSKVVSASAPCASGSFSIGPGAGKRCTCAGGR